MAQSTTAEIVLLPALPRDEQSLPGRKFGALTANRLLGRREETRQIKLINY